jgi:hypothetical protein
MKKGITAEENERQKHFLVLHRTCARLSLYNNISGELQGYTDCILSSLLFKRLTSTVKVFLCCTLFFSGKEIWR